MKQIFEVAPWNVVSHEFNPQNQRLVESITSLGNENLGMRGFFEEGYHGDSLPGIYLGGVWFPDKTRVGWWKNGYPKYFGKVINAVNFMKVKITVNGEQLDLATQTPRDFSLNLDMKHAKLTRQFTVAIGKTTVQFTFERFISAAVKELVGQKIVVKNLGKTPLKLTITSAIDANVHNEDANYDEQFWDVVKMHATSQWLTMVSQTKPNDFGTERFSVGNTSVISTPLEFVGSAKDELQVANTYQGVIAAGGQTSFEKKNLYVSSRDMPTLTPISQTCYQAIIQKLNELATKLKDEDFAALAAKNAEVWAKRWQSADVKIDGDDAAQQGIRFNLFQLFATYYGNDARLNIGPKGFTGEKYGGATYWDTEAFALPVYLGVSNPAVAKNLLKYRFNQLSGAFHNAKEQGLDGALFPMVTFNGIECHNEWEITFEEIHRNGDIAFAIYNYTRYTGDTSYVLHEGAEVLVAISRFWADRVHFSKRANKYMIAGVTGPDEYQNNVDNNWFTNLLAQWTLNYTLKVLGLVDDAMKQKLAVSAEEQQKWREIADEMYLPEDKQLGIFVQNDGFLDKEIKPVSALNASDLPLNQNWSWDKILRSPYIKQADVLHGIWYFIDEFSPKQKEANFDFYEPLTVHESSLSASIHAILAADLHKNKKALELYQRTARLDLDNYNNDTEDGLHITSMTGSWLAIVQGFAGMRIKHGELTYAPFLPEGWKRYSFRQQFRDRVIEVTVDNQATTLTLISGKALDVKVNEVNYHLEKQVKING